MKGALAAVAAALALAGCQLAPLKTVPGAAGEGRAALATLARWQATGRVAVRAADGGFSASFDWHEVDEHGELAIRGPFGAGAARVSLSSERIRIESGGEPVELAAPFAELEPELTARIGFPLPLAALRYWLLGIPAPQAPSVGTGGGFEQSGWQVVAGAFAAIGGSPAQLPTRLTLSRGATRIRVVVDHWQIGGG